MNELSYRRYLLGVLLLVGVISFFDRFVFALALEPIKKDLGLSDSQLGLMTGIGFAAFYALAGIPIARWADKGNRVTISALAVGLVGVMASLCGAASNFTQLLLAKAGLAVGEAGSVPTSQSLIAEYFDRAERPQATAIYTMGYPISMILGYLSGGYLIDLLGWRGTFLVIGIPGVLVAVLVKTTLKEPRLQRQRNESSNEQPAFSIVLSNLWMQKTYRQILIAFCVNYFFIMGSSQWLATFFMRTHSMETAELGVWLALSWGLFGIVGNYLGGYFATRYAPGKERRQMRTLVIVTIVFGFLNAAVYLPESHHWALIFVALSAFVGSLSNGVLFSSMQSLAIDSMRSVSITLVFLMSNLIGIGLGPLALGITSDILMPYYGTDSLRYALLLFSPGLFWVAFHYWQASKSIEEDISRVEDQETALQDKCLGYCRRDSQYIPSKTVVESTAQ